jgi:hypothetical protein
MIKEGEMNRQKEKKSKREREGERAEREEWKGLLFPLVSFSFSTAAGLTLSTVYY